MRRAVTRTGILGGSFNPAHRGHRRISLAAIDALGLDEVWWLVSPGNPLKDGAADMAPLIARVASAREAARGAPIRVTAIEREFGTRFTAETLRRLIARYPNRRFVWIMGTDNLESFHLWRDWRGIARSVTIAVIARPGYDGRVRAVRAMGWLRRFVHPQAQTRAWTEWSPPAILILRLPPDSSSATAIRAADPDWHLRSARVCSARVRSAPGQPVRDMLTRQLIR